MKYANIYKYEAVDKDTTHFYVWSQTPPCDAKKNKLRKKALHVDRLVVGVSNETVEVIVLFLRYGSLLFGPDGLHHIHSLTVHLDGEGHEG